MGKHEKCFCVLVSFGCSRTKIRRKEQFTLNSSIYLSRNISNHQQNLALKHEKENIEKVARNRWRVSRFQQKKLCVFRKCLKFLGAKSSSWEIQ
jgi:hypothetical protein